MVERHIGTGHAAAHILQSVGSLESARVWQAGDIDVVESTEAGEKREFRVAAPATLSPYQRSLVGWHAADRDASLLVHRDRVWGSATSYQAKQ